MPHLVREAAAARTRLQAMPAHMLWKVEDPMENTLIVTQGGWETRAPKLDSGWAGVHQAPNQNSPPPPLLFKAWGTKD